MRNLLQSFSYSIWLIFLAGYVTLVTTAIISLYIAPPQAQLTLLLLFIGYGVLFSWSLVLVARGSRAQIWLYLTSQLLLIAGMILLNPTASKVESILLLPIAAQATLLLPLRPGFLWVLGYFAFELVMFRFSFGRIGIENILLPLGGYIGFGAFGATLRQAEMARIQNDLLLKDLQVAHHQLQTYTAQAEQLAVSQERNRLAREMHDSLGHRLTVAVVQLEGAQRLIGTDPDRAGQVILSMRAQLKDALAELRQMLGALRTETAVSPTVDTDLRTAVVDLVHTFQSATGLPIQLSLPDQLPPLTEHQHRTLFRAAQESLTNVQRHAQASQAWITLSRQNSILLLTTEDDGQGFPEMVEDGRFGLRGLSERATQLGGDISLLASQHGGAKLQLRLPLTDQEPHHA